MLDEVGTQGPLVEESKNEDPSNMAIDPFEKMGLPSKLTVESLTKYYAELEHGVLDLALFNMTDTIYVGCGCTDGSLSIIDYTKQKNRPYKRPVFRIEKGDEGERIDYNYLEDSTYFKEVLYEHSDAVTSIAANPNVMTEFLTASWDHTLQWWHFGESEIEYQNTMKSHNDRIYKAKWLENGMIISCGKDRTVKQADFDTGKAFLMAKNEKGAIMDFDVSDTLLAYAGEDGVCGLIDLKKPKELVHSFEMKNQSVLKVAFNPFAKGSRVALVAGDEQLTLYDFNANIPIWSTTKFDMSPCYLGWLNERTFAYSTYNAEIVIVGMQRDVP